MSAPMPPPATSGQDPYRRMIWGLIAVLAVVCAVIFIFVMLSWALGCGTMTACMDRLGFGDLFARFPFLSVCCVAFIIIGAVAAILGATFWSAILERHRGIEQYPRKRLPPE